MKIFLSVVTIGLLLHSQLAFSLGTGVSPAPATSASLERLPTAFGNPSSATQIPDLEAESIKEVDQSSKAASHGTTQAQVSPLSKSSDNGITQFHNLFSEVQQLLKTNNDPQMLLRKYDAAFVLVRKMEKVRHDATSSFNLSQILFIK